MEAAGAGGVFSAVCASRQGRIVYYVTPAQDQLGNILQTIATQLYLTRL